MCRSWRARACVAGAAALFTFFELSLDARSAAAPLPSTLARFAGVAGRLDYTGHRTDRASAPEISGSAVIAGDAFEIVEYAPTYALDATPGGVTIRSQALLLRASDPLDADVLLNAWPVVAATLARTNLEHSSALAWRSPDIVVYTDAGGTIVTGATDLQPALVSFTFDGWLESSGVPFPTRIVRLRHGVVDASFQIDTLSFARSQAPWSARMSSTNALERSSILDRVAALAARRPVPGSAALTSSSRADGSPASLVRAAQPFPWLLVFTCFGCLLLGLCVTAWFWRDAFVLEACRRLAQDPRAWRRASGAVFFDSDGVLHFEGNQYRVGPQFIAREVEVQLSPLFLRVVAPGVTRAVVLPRRLPRRASPQPRKPSPARRHRVAAGFSVVETLVAVTLFCAVAMGAIYPALIAVARADFIAAQKRAAVLAARNALAAQEAACAYGSSIVTGATTRNVGSLTVNVVVSESTAGGARDIRVRAADASGKVLVSLVTTVGPPVPAPATLPTGH